MTSSIIEVQFHTFLLAKRKKQIDRDVGGSVLAAAAAGSQPRQQLQTFHAGADRRGGY